MLAQNNPHLKSHRRRNSSIPTTSGTTLNDKPLDLPGQVVAGMEHTKKIADALYGKWAEGLRNRWPVVS